MQMGSLSQRWDQVKKKVINLTHILLKHVPETTPAQVTRAVPGREAMGKLCL